MSQADASAEWLEGAHVGGLLFRCQCLSNRAACYLKSGKLGLCVDDAGAALAALGASPDDATKQLRLKLLARRGMCLCQLERCTTTTTTTTTTITHRAHGTSDNQHTTPPPPQPWPAQQQEHAAAPTHALAHTPSCSVPRLNYNNNTSQQQV